MGGMGDSHGWMVGGIRLLLLCFCIVLGGRYGDGWGTGWWQMQISFRGRKDGKQMHAYPYILV